MGALFGTTIQEMSANNFGADASCLKSVATVITFSMTALAYFFVVTFALNYLPKVGGDQGETDFGLTNANCYGENPWITDFEEKLLHAGVVGVVVLFMVNISAAAVQCFVHWKDAKKIEN